MKNRDLDKHVKQHHHDLRVNEENIRRLADDITRIEFQFKKLWEFLHENNPAITHSPDDWNVICSFCERSTTKYVVERLEGTSYYEVKCKSCLCEEEAQRIYNEDENED